MIGSLRRMTPAAALLLLGATPGPAVGSGSTLSIVILTTGDAADGATRAARRVVGNALTGRGHAVFDRRLPAAPVPQLLERFAAKAGPPLDVAIVLTVSSRIRQGRYTRHLHLRLDAVLVDIATHRTLASVERQPARPPRIAAGCAEACQADLSIRLAKAEARKLGTKITGLLPARATDRRRRAPQPVRSAARTEVIVVRGATPGDLAEIEAYLAVLPGSWGFRRLDGADDAARYRYRSAPTTRPLADLLGEMIDRMRLRARVRRAGSDIVIDATPGRAQGPHPATDW